MELAQNRIYKWNWHQININNAKYCPFPKLLARINPRRKSVDNAQIFKNWHRLMAKRAVRDRFLVFMA